MDKYERRRLNLIKLRDEKCNGKASVLAKKIERDQSYVSRMLYEEGKDGKKRIADEMIEVIEDAFDLPRGWLDSETGSFEDSKNLVVRSFEKKQKGFLTITQFNEVGGSMGVGVLLQDQPGQITAWEVTAEWLAKNIPTNTGADNLKIITGFGNSMIGMYNPGDPLVIDVGIRECDHDGVFFFRVGNEGFVKILQRIPGQGIRVISKNTDYEPWTITKDMDFQVLGKVLKVWKSDFF
jgi:phage repressor protein C with HTH and peptisase S24 domain